MSSEQRWETIRRAADRLEEVGLAAPAGPWQAGERCVWHADGGVEAIVADGDAGDGGCLDEATAAWIATMSPAIAGPLVKWLRAARIEFQFGSATTRDVCWSHALAVARAILGEEGT